MLIDFQHLAALLITQQLIGQVQEAMVPFLFLTRRKKQVDASMKKQDALQKVEYFNGEVTEEVQKQAGMESEMEEYNVGIYVQCMYNVGLNVHVCTMLMYIFSQFVLSTLTILCMSIYVYTHVLFLCIGYMYTSYLLLICKEIIG